MTAITSRVVLGCVGFCVACAVASAARAQTRTLRVVTYNIEDDINGATAPRPGLITPSGGGTVQQGGVLEGIGEEISGNDKGLTRSTRRVLPALIGVLIP